MVDREKLGRALQAEAEPGLTTDRLAEADKRTSCLRRSIRSRRIIPVHTRLNIWQTCVLSSALHGLHALRLSSADTHKLSQWYHRQIRAVTHTPAHKTKISNHDLRAKYKLEDPVTILHPGPRPSCEKCAPSRRRMLPQLPKPYRNGRRR